MTSQDNFAVRFAKHKDELEWLFMELYHNREGLEGSGAGDGRSLQRPQC